MLRKAKGDQGGFRISPGATFQIFNLKSAVGEADFDSFQESNLRPLWTPHIPLEIPSGGRGYEERWQNSPAPERDSQGRGNFAVGKVCRKATEFSNFKELGKFTVLPLEPPRG